MKADKILKMWERLKEKVTPIKMFALLTIIIAMIDNISSILQHATGGGVTNYANTNLEWVVRGFFLFCGVFGLIGNGRTKTIRATIVSLPYLYLMVFYATIYFQFHNEVLITLSVMMGIPGIWILLFGDFYE